MFLLLLYYGDVNMGLLQWLRNVMSLDITCQQMFLSVWHHLLVVITY